MNSRSGNSGTDALKNAGDSVFLVSRCLSRQTISPILLPSGDRNAQDKNDGRESPDYCSVTHCGSLVMKHHGCSKPLVKIVQRQHLGEGLQEVRHYLKREKAPREEHHREHYGVGRGRGALSLLYQAGKYHSDSDKGKDVKHDKKRKPGVYVQ